MTREEINQVFEWLEINCNKDNWLDFKMTSDNNITAYFKNSNKTFAEFYTKQILKVIKEYGMEGEK